MHTIQEGDELAEPEVVLLPRPGLLSRIGRGHVKLYILDLPITQAAGQVIDLSTGDLPVSNEGPPHCWGVNEGALSTRPPLGGCIRTSHPRPYTPPQCPARRISLPLQP